ncbi:hypothetical protein [Vampirovibrio sp.]|uniref:hypothetical protein n=1 Tax=Vampirovibrio sp. TaxID=2717857 RepID=UPI003593065E
MMNEPEYLPATPEAALPTEPAQAVQSDSTIKRSKLPDFQPLGAIRDYFTELMKQDSIR